MTRRAVVFEAHGDPSVLALVERPEPHAGPGQVRARMRAAGVQPFDCAFRRGDLRLHDEGRHGERTEGDQQG